MDEFNFDDWKKQARIIDDGIKKLEKRWESAQNILCHRGENAEEAKKIFNDFIQPVKQIRKEIIEDMGPRSDYLKDMDRFLDECETACDELKQGVDDIEALFSEYGYVKPETYRKDHNQEVENTGIDINYDVNNSILNIEEMKILTLDSSPFNQPNNVSPIPKSINFNCNINGNTPRYIATPVIKSVASVMQAESLKKKIMLN
ncbi:hypothetical protein PV327_009717 [Microctonus hyperodae]|uniref:Uncharacterized protein n=1 Tax=Microctonus hyperodae TaxID=165561 RepID=A0AA39F006_MICHY|nr:hypothetical protein PV327_009717 [Microctonus hyperodae]